jgi:hypothetical protein
MSGGVTLLRAHGRRLAKVVTAAGGIIDYDLARIFDLAEVSVASLGELADLLGGLERRRDYCVVRGAVADPRRLKGVRRLVYRDPATGEEPTLREAARRWVALDFDGLPRPGWIAPADLLGWACVAVRGLPAAFRRARFIVQATSSHGLKPGVRLRLWCWLSRPASGAELKYWLRGAAVDRSVFAPAQLVYTAAPVFLTGAFDPLPYRLAMMPGDAEVAVPGISRLRPKSSPGRLVEALEGPADVGRLVRFVETAAAGERNRRLYWAACRLAEQHIAGHGALLEGAAVRAGLSAIEAAATVRSALRQGGS